MVARNARGPEFGGDRIGARDVRSDGSREPLAPRHHDRQAVPDTTMGCAFLLALRCWLDEHRPNTSRKITSPTGVVSDDELARVRAIFGVKQ